MTQIGTRGIILYQVVCLSFDLVCAKILNDGSKAADLCVSVPPSLPPRSRLPRLGKCPYRKGSGLAGGCRLRIVFFSPDGFYLQHTAAASAIYSTQETPALTLHHTPLV